MSSAKTVVCSYCHTKGHNRQTCPQLHADIESLKESHGASHPLVQEYKQNRASISKSASRRAKMPRSCTYCHTLGHNRRTCVVLAHDRESARAKNIAWRETYFHNVKEIGLGVGAMVRMANRRLGIRPGDAGGLWMVLRHEWDILNHVNCGERGVLCQQISNVGRRVYITAPMRTSPSLHINGWEIVSPSYDFGMPDDWMEGDSGLDTLFENHDKDSRII